jgi:adenosylcobinamide-phosphate synthase
LGIVDLLAQNALILVLAVILDRLLPEPPNPVHPVVWMGKAVGALERISPKRPAAALFFGAFVVVVIVGGSGAVAWLVSVALNGAGGIAYVVGGTLALRTTFTVRGLSQAGRQTQRSLQQGGLNEARTSLTSLVSRDTASLSHSMVAAAAIESVAENTTDSFVGPWLAFAVLGLPGAVAYRAINTLDSMLGYRGAYEYLGKTSARLDDLVNLIPARLSALLLLLAGGLVRLPVGRGWRIMKRDHGLTASPNSGWTMSAMAGLLGIRLEKPGHYHLGGELPPPCAGDIGRSLEVVVRTAVLALVAGTGLLAVRWLFIG